MDRDELTKLVLLEVERRCETVQSRPKPPDWRRWDIREYEIDLEYGPRYSPTWFGDVARTEAGRVRVLRTVYRLADAGLLIVVKSEGGRLERVRMTPAGIQAATEIRNVKMSPAASIAGR